MTSSVLDKLPHRKPFRFVTSIEELVAGKSGTGSWDVSGDEDFFAGHFPGQPLVPGVLLTEALAQLCGLVAFSSAAAGGPAARLAQVSMKFQAGVAPPAKVRLESSLTREMSGLYLFDVRALVSGVVAATGTLVLANVPAT